LNPTWEDCLASFSHLRTLLFIQFLILIITISLSIT
jgi:hypothetical protein